MVKLKGSLSKSELICMVLAHCGPLTRVEILRRVYALSHGPRTRTFKRRSNHCYFTRYGRGNGGYISVVKRGLVEIVGKQGNTLVYGLTDFGRRNFGL